MTIRIRYKKIKQIEISYVNSLPYHKYDTDNVLNFATFNY